MSRQPGHPSDPEIDAALRRVHAVAARAALSAVGREAFRLARGQDGDSDGTQARLLERSRQALQHPPGLHPARTQRAVLEGWTAGRSAAEARGEVAG